MSRVHIFTAPCQPATRFEDRNFDPPLVSEWPAKRRIWCRCCGERHNAENCVVQVFYDGLYFYCAPGKGCQDPERIARARRREHRNRSRGQKRRWARWRRERSAPGTRPSKT